MQEVVEKLNFNAYHLKLLHIFTPRMSSISSTYTLMNWTNRFSIFLMLARVGRLMKHIYYSILLDVEFCFTFDFFIALVIFIHK